MQGIRKLQLSWLVVVLLAGCGDKTDGVATEEKKPTQVAARVNGTELTVHQVNYALQRIPNIEKDQVSAASLQVVRNLVDQEVIAQKALADKLDRDPEVVQALDAARRQILAEAWMSRKLGTPPEPSDPEVSDYFDKHPELFARRKIYRLQEISIRAPSDKHEEIRAQLVAARTLNDFAEWLKTQSYPVKVAQAVKPAEQVPLQILPQLAQVPDGEALVLNMPDGLMVVMVADSQAQPVTLEQARPAIEKMLQAQARQKAAKAELDAAKAAAKIEYVGEFADAGMLDTAVTEAAAEAPDAKALPDAGADTAPPAAADGK